MAGVTTYYQTGIHSARPANGSGCVLYSCTTHNLVYRDDGTSWTTFITLPGAGMTNPMTTKGDIILGDTSGTPSRLAAGTSGYVLTSAGAGAFPAWAAASGGSLTSFDSTLAANVTMTTNGTYYDGPNSGVLATGTWLVWWKALLESAGATASHQYQGKLWDGTTVYDEQEMDMMGAVAGFGISLSGFAVVVLGSTATLKISVTSSNASQVLVRDTSTLSGLGANSHTPTRISGLKIA